MSTAAWIRAPDLRWRSTWPTAPTASGRSGSWFASREKRRQHRYLFRAWSKGAARDRLTLRFTLVPVPAVAAMAATALLLAVGVALAAGPWPDTLQPGPSGFRQHRPDLLGSTDGSDAPQWCRNSGPASDFAARRRRDRWPAAFGDPLVDLPRALQYSVQVLSLAGDLVWQGRSAGEETIVPPQVALEPGQRYYVWVEARLPSGAVSRSDAVAFRVAPD